jgi:hypothetical protein
MPDAVLLLLRVPESYDDRVAMMKVEDRVDVVSLRGHRREEVRLAEHAFMYAKEQDKHVVTLMILNSDLYHWGYNDLILPGPAKTGFIGHIREQIFNKSLETANMLEELALRYGVHVEIKRVETRDPVSAALEEARKDYDRIFIGKEKKRLFPIFKKTIEQHLRKSISVPIAHY